MKIQNTDSTWFTEYSKEVGSAFSLETTNLLHQEKSAYQNIEIYQTKTFGKLMVLDGFIMLTTRDNFLYHEMISHPALFSHAKPRHVAIVGGGDCGTLQQVAKHSCVERITQIEIDERVTRISEEYFPELCTSNDDPRTHFEFCDAIEWMHNAPSNSLDIIIVDSTDPIGPAIGLFQKEFYENCWSVLRDNGLVIQQSGAPLVNWETITSPMHNEMHAAKFNQTKSLFFPQPVYPTGWWSATMAAKNDIHLIRDIDASNLSFDTKYYNYDIHLGAFAVPSFLKS